MAEKIHQEPDRRTFLKTGAIVSAATAVAAAGKPTTTFSAQDQPTTLPKRKLGKTGVEVTILDQGAVRGPSYDRILRASYASGVRVFDTAKVYGTEPNLRKWFEQAPEVRKDIFLITKDMPRAPRDMIKMLDERLEALAVDHVDLFFIHGLGDDHSLDDAMNFVRGPEFKEVAETLRKSGKTRFVGFSTHHKDRPQIIQAAAEGGIVDAIMLQYTPWLDKDSPLNRALDAAHEKGIGLITMKHIAGQFFGDKPKGDILADVQKKVPMLKERNLTPFQGLLHAIWTDERIACSCVSMRNTDQIRQNVDAALRFEPVKTADLRQLRDAALAHGPMLCADCDGRCMRAAGTKAELGNLTRYLTYYRYLGDRSEARRLYAAMPAHAKNWSNADLEAARQACPNKLNFAQLLPEADQYLA